MEVSGQLHVPAALPSGKELPVQIGYADSNLQTLSNLANNS
jgi:hypothetical protein